MYHLPDHEDAERQKKPVFRLHYLKQKQTTAIGNKVGTNALAPICAAFLLISKKKKICSDLWIPQ